jgi:hypothetical protein
MSAVVIIERISNNYATNSYPYSAISQKKEGFGTPAPLHSFDSEDEAIISAEARFLSELDKFYAGKSTETDLALAGITSKIQVQASAKVIKTKKDMLDTVLDAVLDAVDE